jgi:hypothetical protein
MHGPYPVPAFNINSLLHTSASDTGNHKQLSSVAIQWVTDIVICCVCSLSVLITKGGIRGYLYVRHLSVTGMTRMTKNMKSAGEYETD